MHTAVASEKLHFISGVSGTDSVCVLPSSFVLH